MNVNSGIHKLKEAIDLKKEIRAVYAKYHALSKAVQVFSQGKIKHFDLKRAVDAIHYFGGGWPHPNSKGRMEAMCDALAGMYKILTFIGKGDMVEDYLRTKHGITITITKSRHLKDVPFPPDVSAHLSKEYKIPRVASLSELTTVAVEKCDGLQSTICAKADIVRDDLRPSIKKDLQIEEPEYNRIVDIMKIHQGPKKQTTRMDGKVKKVGSSFTNFNSTTKILRQKK